MELHPRQVSPECSPTQRRLLRKVILESLSLAILAGVVLTAKLNQTRTTWLLDDALNPPILGLGDGSQTRLPIDVSGSKAHFNREAYNRDRSRAIANDTRKLLNLAIALKSELNQNPGDRLGGDAEKKAKEIEKLAHKVKEKMQVNPNLEPDPAAR